MKRKLIIVGAIVIAALGIGISAAASASDSDASTPSTVGAKAVTQGPAPQYSRNASGETFGSTSDANSSEQFPDLIYVSTDQGGRGYIKKKDLEEPEFTSPKDAAAWSQQNASKPRVLTAYESDGKTVVGTFTRGRR